MTSYPHPHALGLELSPGDTIVLKSRDELRYLRSLGGNPFDLNPAMCERGGQEFVITGQGAHITRDKYGARVKSYHLADAGGYYWYDTLFDFTSRFDPNETDVLYGKKGESK